MPVALIVEIVPPLGLIGWASPLTAAGLLFPGTGWFGLVAATIVSGCLPVRPRSSVTIGVAAVMISYATYGGDPKPPAHWQGINTEFGAVDSSDITAEYLRARTIQERIFASEAQVIVFPESVLKDWTGATDVFWSETLAFLRDRGKTVLIGAAIPTTPSLSARDRHSYDFWADLDALRGAGPTASSSGIFGAQSVPVPLPYRNIIVIRGAISDTFDQRIPVPVAMWTPFTGTGVCSMCLAAPRFKSPTTGWKFLSVTSSY